MKKFLAFAALNMALVLGATAHAHAPSNGGVRGGVRGGLTTDGQTYSCRVTGNNIGGLSIGLDLGGSTSPGPAW